MRPPTFCELLLRNRVESLEADVAVYREMAQLALAALHDLTVQQDRQRERYLALVEECRRLRSQSQRAA